MSRRLGLVLFAAALSGSACTNEGSIHTALSTRATGSCSLLSTTTASVTPTAPGDTLVTGSECVLDPCYPETSECIDPPDAMIEMMGLGLHAVSAELEAELEEDPPAPPANEKNTIRVKNTTTTDGVELWIGEI